MPSPPLSTARAYAMLGNENLWDVVRRCHELLTDAGVPYGVVGGVAVCLHGYQRNTVDLDLLVAPEHGDAIKQTLIAAGFSWNDDTHEFRSESGIPVQFLLTGHAAGTGSTVRLPDPADEGTTTEVDGVHVLRLSKLVESKLACGLGNLRRTHKDFADVVELIIVRDLGRDFARHLHRSLRTTFRELVQRVRGQ